MAASEKEESPIHILEIFGGEVGVSALAIRRRLKCGKNFDIRCNIDLMKPAHQRGAP